MSHKISSLLPLVVLSAGLLSARAEDKPAAAPAPAKADLSKALSMFENAAPAPSINATAVVVTVGSKVILGAELEREAMGLQANAARRMPPEQMAMILPRIQEQAVQNLVNKQVLLNTVAEKKITVGADEIKKAQEDVMKNAPAGMSMDDALKQAGLTKEQFTQEMTQGLSIQKLMKEQMDKSAVTEADVKAFYDKNPEQFKQPETASARHILIGFGDGAADATKKAAAKKKADEVRARLVKGEDFAKVCAETSDDPGSKTNGGLYEKFPKGQMVPPFENACFTQKIGEIGEPVETTFGYHIIKVEARDTAGVLKFDEVKERLKTFLENRKQSEVAREYIETLRKGAKIEYGKGFEPTLPTTPKMPMTAPKGG